MKHYVPRRNSRESLIHIGSESKLGHGSIISSSYCGGAPSYQPEAITHTDQKRPEDENYYTLQPSQFTAISTATVPRKKSPAKKKKSLTRSKSPRSSRFASSSPKGKKVVSTSPQRRASPARSKISQRTTTNSKSPTKKASPMKKISSANRVTTFTGSPLKRKRSSSPRRYNSPYRKIGVTSPIIEES